MIEEIDKYKNKDHIVLLPKYDLEIIDSLEYTIGNIIKINNIPEDKKIIELINNSKIKKIYLVGNDNFYRFLLPRIKKNIKVCWIFKNSFSDLSNGGVRYVLNCIFEFIDRSLINTIGCIDKDTYEVLTNSGYNCEFIELKVVEKKSEYKKSNTIGILSNDFDPNNNFYNQLAAIKLVDYEYVKFKCVMKATKDFVNLFDIKYKYLENIDDIITSNCVNLYINFTNTNEELICKSFNSGIPCILGNTNIFDKNKYLKENLVMKSDDDINEIAKKIEFAKNNRKKIISEYNNMKCL